MVRTNDKLSRKNLQAQTEQYGHGALADLLKQAGIALTPLLYDLLKKPASELSEILGTKLKKLTGNGTRLAGETYTGDGFRLAGEKIYPKSKPKNG